jgi:hypothetical protein
MGRLQIWRTMASKIARLANDQVRVIRLSYASDDMQDHVGIVPYYAFQCHDVAHSLRRTGAI